MVAGDDGEEALLHEGYAVFGILLGVVDGVMILAVLGDESAAVDDVADDEDPVGFGLGHLPGDFALRGVVLAAVSEDYDAGGLEGGLTGAALGLEDGLPVSRDGVGEIGSGAESGEFCGVDKVLRHGGGADFLYFGGDGLAFGAGDREVARGGGMPDDGDAGRVGWGVAELEVGLDEERVLGEEKGGGEKEK